jgi:hypothetical protein
MAEDVARQATGGGRSFSLVPQLDQYPWLVRFTQTMVGKAVVLAVFCGLLYFFWPRWVFFTATSLFFCIFMPKQRHIILVVASLASLYIGRTYLQWDLISDLARTYDVSGPFTTTPGAVLVIGVVFLCCFLLVYFTKASRSVFRIRRPILLVVSCYLILVCFVSYVPVHGFIKFGLWVFLLIFGKYMWYLFYSLIDCNVPGATPFKEQLGHYMPFWYASVIPYHRGATNLRRIKATTPVELAKCQLSGLKLLIWACYLSFFSVLYHTVCHGRAYDISGMINTLLRDGSVAIFFQNKLIYTIDSWSFFLDIPPYEYAFEQAAAGRPLPFYWNWIAAIGRFFIVVLHLAIISHAAIAILRMAGYKALRNVYKPLLSVSLIDFWNRIYYYYKEMLVMVFFYPTFLRYFKTRQILRYYFATMAAAFFGNFLFHFLLHFDSIIAKGMFAALQSDFSLMFYFFVLGNAIFVSQWRKLKGGRYAWNLPQPFTTITVLLFYSIVSIFGYDDKWDDLPGNLKFFLALFNITVGGNG